MLAKRMRSVARRVVRSIERRARPARLEILTYHFVTARAHSFNRNGHVVRPDVFRAQLRWLKQTHEVVRLRDATKLSERGRPYVCVTFDDGYADNLAEAYPILEAERVPATMFVCPSVVGNRDLLWRDKVRHLIDTRRDADFVAYLRTTGGRYRFEELEQIGFYRWSKRARSIGDMQIQRDLTAFCAREGIDTAALARDAGLFIDEIRARPWLDIGNHSWSHPVMPALDLEGQRAEIERGAAAIRAAGVEPVGFALPFTDHDANTARANGEQLMLTVEKRSNPLPVGRVLHRRMAPATLAGLQEIL